MDQADLTDAADRHDRGRPEQRAPAGDRVQDAVVAVGHGKDERGDGRRD